MSGLVWPVYAGIVVSDVAASAQWYARELTCPVTERGNGWCCLTFPDHSTIELFAGDPARPGETFPSYGGAPGPPVMPGYAVDEPDDVVANLRVARSLPDWHVVVAPDGLRVVVTRRDTDHAVGLVGFHLLSPAVAEQRAFLDALGATDALDWGPAPAVVPRVAAARTGRILDPDGTAIELVAPGDGAGTGA